MLAVGGTSCISLISVAAADENSLTPLHRLLPAETQRSGFGGKRTSDRVRESCRLRRDEGFVVRSDDSQHRICLVCGEAAALPNALGGAWPYTPKLRAEAHTHF